MRIANVEEMRKIEKATDASGHSYAAMMEMAGHGVAKVADAMILHDPGKRILILVGPGNNGGDGLVTARYLLERGDEVTVYIWKRSITGDENFRRLKRRKRNLGILWAENDPEFTKLREEVANADLVVDALLGTGVARPIEGTLADLLAAVREQAAACRGPSPVEMVPLGVPRFPIADALTVGLGPSGQIAPPEPYWDDGFGTPESLADMADADESAMGPLDYGWEDEESWMDEEAPSPQWPRPVILAVDCPTGLDCDTGGLDPAVLPADVTVTFGFPKWGQLQFPGAGACGLLSVAEIGVPPELAGSLQASLIEATDVRRWLPKRPADSHKGTFGRAMIGCGSMRYTGAAYLSGAAAIRAGAGLVTLAIPLPLHASLAGVLPEVTWLPLPAGPQGTHEREGARELLESLESYDALLVGPGLTTRAEAGDFLDALFADGGLDRAAWAGRTVVDADALNLLAGVPPEAWAPRLPAMSILTPHPGEMARLTGSTTGEVNEHRIRSAREAAAAWGHIVVLKGAHTVIAAPDGRTGVLPFAVAALATAGSGDVLAGAIVAMLAQGLPAFEAAACGAYIHGHAGMLIARDQGAAGTMARDIADALPDALRQLTYAT